MTQKNIILGSGSPRRKEILDYFSLPYIQKTSYFDEDSVPFQGEPQRYVLELSLGKALAIAKDDPKSVILTADTIVYREGRIYGKPENEEAAFESLTSLIGLLK